MKRAVLYLRVSTAEQTRRAFSEEGYSIEAQREACLRKVAQLEAETDPAADEYVDRGESARSADRPELQRLLARLDEQRDVGYVIVHKLDRLARSVADHLAIAVQIRNAGAELVSVTESIDDSPMGQYMETIFAANAQLYSANLSTEAKKGLHKKASLGGTPFAAPIGYLNVRERDEASGVEFRTVSLDSKRAPHVRWAFAAYASGAYTLDTLHAALKNRGLRARRTRKQPERPLSRTQIARMLAKPYYVGIVRYGGVEYEGRHEPLVDKETFARVQRVLEAHSQAGERDRKHHHYLKGSLRCHCGERLTFVKGRSKTGRLYDYFACIGRIKGTGCKLPYLPAHEVEEKVAAAYATVKIGQLGRGTTERKWGLHLVDVRKALTEAIAGMRTVNRQEARRQRARIESLDADRAKFLQAYYANALPLDLLKVEQDRLSDELTAAQAALRSAEADLDRLNAAFDLALEAGRRMEEVYGSADGLKRRQWNQALFVCFRVKPTEEIEGELRDEFRDLTAADTPKRLRAGARAGVSSGPGSNKELLAEGVGFEPTRRLTTPNGFQGRDSERVFSLLKPFLSLGCQSGCQSLLGHAQSADCLARRVLRFSAFALSRKSSSRSGSTGGLPDSSQQGGFVRLADGSGSSNRR